MGTSEIFKIVVVVCVLITGLAGPAPAKIIYVDDDAIGANDGSSWADAFVYLQKALAIAEPGDEVRVARGLYRPDQGAPPALVPSRGHGPMIEIDASGSPYAVFQLKNGVTIRGGFAGAGAEEPNDRDVERYETILSGDLYGNDEDLWGPGNPIYDLLHTDNSLHVVESMNTDSTAVLDGFVVESAVDSGLYNLGGSPHIANCVFRRSSAQNFGGGGLHSGGGEPSLSNCAFQQNSTQRGGGAISIVGTQLTLLDCRFASNWALMEGGAVYCVDSDLSLTGCTFEKNAARWGGAIHHTAGTLTLAECRFEGNAAESGGAVAVAVEAVSMLRCLFRGNWAIGPGGAIESAVPMVLEECVFSGNSAGDGGAVYASRLSSPLARAEITAMTRCILTGNRAWDTGGALCSDRAEFTITGCTFADNWARTGGTLGWLAGSPQDYVFRVTMDNCIVWDGLGSVSTSRRLRRRVAPPSPQEQDVVIRYSDVQGGWPGEGNIDADPCFAAPGHWADAAFPGTMVGPDNSRAAWVDGDYHVKSQAGRWDPTGETWILDEVTSPCIDAGDPNSPVADEPFPNGGVLNMGVYGGTAEAGKSYPYFVR